MNNSRFKRLNPVELAVIQPDLLRVPSILRHELFSNDIELVVRKEDATSNRRLGSLNFNLSLSLSLIVIESQVEKPWKTIRKTSVEKAETKGK